MLKLTFNPQKTSQKAQIGESIRLNLNLLKSMLQGVHTKTPGSWLYPHQVDNFIEIDEVISSTNGIANSSNGTAGNNRVIELIVDSIAGTQVDCILEGSNDDEPIDYIEIRRIDRGQPTFPNIEMWDKIFDLSFNVDESDSMEVYTVAPNGNLYVKNNGDSKLSLKFQDKESLLGLIGANEFFALNYSIAFHFRMPFQDDPVYCIVDPVVQIRSNPR